MEPNSLNVKKYKISNSELDGIRVAFITDMHFKKNDFKRFDKMLKMLKRQEPDILLIGGDFP
ncbi:metallophosphoesterase, partial [bacterium]|nr:metallophosphoesterase [bacterium]